MAVNYCKREVLEGNLGTDPDGYFILFFPIPKTNIARITGWRNPIFAVFIMASLPKEC